MNIVFVKERRVFGMGKDLLDYLEEFEEFGYVIRECPICGSECEPTEIDNDGAYCSNCDEVVSVEPLL